MFGVACVLIIKNRDNMLRCSAILATRVYIDYRASPFSRVRVKFALNRLVAVLLSYCAPTIRGEGGGVGWCRSAGWTPGVDWCIKHTTYHGIISNYNKSSIVQVINRV